MTADELKDREIVEEFRWRLRVTVVSAHTGKELQLTEFRELGGWFGCAVEHHSVGSVKFVDTPEEMTAIEDVTYNTPMFVPSVEDWDLMYNLGEIEDWSSWDEIHGEGVAKAKVEKFLKLKFGTVR